MEQKQKIKYDGLSKNLNVVLNHMDIAEITELMNKEFPEDSKPSQGYLEYLLCKAIREYKGVNLFEKNNQNNKIEHKKCSKSECIITKTNICPYSEINGALCSHCKIPDEVFTARKID